VQSEVPLDRILIVDDDVELCELVIEYLSSEGFTIEAVHDGRTGLECALLDRYALMILDVMLPTLNGLDVLREIRQQKSQIPVLILTARGDEVDRIVGLEVGADDYLGKPFNVRELLARIRAILRRTHADETGSDFAPLSISGIELNPGARSVRLGGERIELTAVEFDILELLMRCAGRVVTRDQIAHEVLGRQVFAHDRSVDVHVSKLRRKLGVTFSSDERIKTVRGTGYIFAVTGEAVRK
jgi:two-component system response regulator CpxR